MTSAIYIINVPTTALLAGETKAILSSKKKMPGVIVFEQIFPITHQRGGGNRRKLFSGPDAFITEIFFFVW